MRKKILCIALAAIVALSCLAVLAGCNSGANDRNTQFELPNGARPDSDFSYFAADDLAKVQAALETDATEDVKKEAVLALWNTANKSAMDKSAVSMMIQESLMGLGSGCDSIEDAFAIVIMHGYTLNAGAAGNNVWYNQFVSAAKKTGFNLGEAIASMAAMTKVQYMDGEGKYYFVSLGSTDGIDSDCSAPDFPYASFLLTNPVQEMDYDTFMQETHALKGPGEIYNMDFFSAELIADQPTIELTSDGYYKLHFEINTSADDALLQQWYRKPQEDMQVGGQSINRYNSYVCDLEVWTTGQVKSYWAEYSRDAGMASGITRDVFHYLWNEEEILNICKKDFRLDELTEVERLSFETVADYVNFYIDADTVEGRANTALTKIIIIAAAVVLVIILIIVIIIVAVVKKKKKKAKQAAQTAEQTTPSCSCRECEHIDYAATSHAPCKDDYYDKYKK